MAQVKISDDINTDSSVIAASTKAVKTALSGQEPYPIGSIYMSTVNVDPSTYFGGIWEALPAGRVLLAQGTSEWGISYSAGSTGGEATHQLTSNEMPSHKHTASSNSTGSHTHTVDLHSRDPQSGGMDIACGTHSALSGTKTTDTTSSSGSHSHTITVNNTGGGAAHNIMQPYLSVYMWQRIE